MPDLMRYEQPIHLRGGVANKAYWFATICRAMPDHILDAPAYPSGNVTNRELIEAHAAATCSGDIDRAEYLEMAFNAYGVSTYDGIAAVAAYESYHGNCLSPYRLYAQYIYDIEFSALYQDIANSSLLSWSKHVQFWPSLDRQVRANAFKRLPWEAREVLRLLFGEYELVPWMHKYSDVQPIRGHFVHISKTDPSMVAFTQDASKGERDIQTTMRPGRYLKKFYPHLSDERVFEIQAEMTGEYDVKFAVTEDEIIDVYLRGPSSCMSHSSVEYAGHIHPVAVYGDSDLHVAYMTLKGTSSIKARALVWPERKVIGRLYGPSDLAEKLRNLLGGIGYDKNASPHNLKGAKIRRITDENGDGDRLIMPYIDGPNSFDVLDKDWCVIGGSLDACYTNGTDYEDTDDGVYCERCEERCSEDDAVSVYTSRRTTQTWCDGCRSAEASYIESLCEYVDDDHVVVVVTHYRPHSHNSTESFADWQDEWYFCDGLEEYVHEDIPSVAMSNGETWCQPYFEEHGIEVDGENYRRGQEPAEEAA